MQIEESISYHNFRFGYHSNIKHEENCVLLLGGALQSMNSWNNYLQRSGENFDSIICDLPGTGESDVLPHDYPIEFLAAGYLCVVYSRWQPASAASSRSYK